MEKTKLLFISGIPTAGKSHLAKVLSNKTGALHLSTDKLRKEITDTVAKEWVNFYRNQDESVYYQNTTAERQWENLRRQTVNIWPLLAEEIKSQAKTNSKVVVEGVSLFPELVEKDFKTKGIMLIGKSRNEVLERIKIFPRWVKEDYLMELQADAFFDIERPEYKKMAEELNWKIFEDSEEALGHCLNYLD